MVPTSVLHSLCALCFFSEWVHSQTLPGMYERHDETTYLLQKSARIHVAPSSGREQVLREIVEDVTNALGPPNAKFLNQHSPHVGKSKDIPYPYEIRKGVSGMGVFSTKPIAKGQVTWRFNPENNKEIYESDIPILRRLLQGKDPDVALWLTQWTYPCSYADCVIFEMDDGRYTNARYDAEGSQHSIPANMDNIARPTNTPSNANMVQWRTTLTNGTEGDWIWATPEQAGQVGWEMVATRALPANTEILDNYTAEWENDEDEAAWWQDFVADVEEGDIEEDDDEEDDDEEDDEVTEPASNSTSGVE